MPKNDNRGLEAGSTGSAVNQLHVQLRAIGFESDKQILEIFGLADEIKVTKAALKESVGRKLAARVLKTWVEDSA